MLQPLDLPGDTPQLPPTPPPTPSFLRKTHLRLQLSAEARLPLQPPASHHIFLVCLVQYLISLKILTFLTVII